MIDNTLYDAYGQRQVSTMFTQLNQYHVVLEVEPSFQQDPQDLRNLYIRSRNGSAIHRVGGVVSGGSATTRFGPSSSSPAPPRPAERRRVSAATSAGAASSAAFNGATASCQVFTEREPGAAQRVHPYRADHGPDHSEPSGTVSGGDAVVQPGSRTRRSATRWTPSTR